MLPLLPKTTKKTNFSMFFDLFKLHTKINFNFRFFFWEGKMLKNKKYCFFFTNMICCAQHITSGGRRVLEQQIVIRKVIQKDENGNFLPLFSDEDLFVKLFEFRSQMLKSPNLIFLKTTLSAYLGITNAILMGWLNPSNMEYSISRTNELQFVFDMIEDRIVRMSLQGKINTSMAKFLLKSKHDYVEPKEPLRLAEGRAGFIIDVNDIIYND